MDVLDTVPLEVELHYKRKFLLEEYIQSQAQTHKEAPVLGKHLVAQLVHILMEAAAQALKAKNSGAVVGISKELRVLVGLGADTSPRNSRFGNFTH